MFYARVEEYFTFSGKTVAMIEIHHRYLGVQKNALQSTQARLREYRKQQARSEAAVAKRW